VIATILTVAIVVVLAAVASVSFIDVANNLREPAPNVADTTGDFELETDGYRTNQVVRITH
jgi:FlaG/FlaF family flagellin (archaellin)